METETRKVFETFLPVFECAMPKITGSDRRIYLAQLSKSLGYGGMRLVCDHFAIDFKTLQKGINELEAEDFRIDAFDQSFKIISGRKRSCENRPVFQRCEIVCKSKSVRPGFCQGIYYTPKGFFIPKLNEVQMYFTSSSITAHFIVNMLTRFWLDNQYRFSNIKKIVLNQDNGTECKSTRNQFIKRILEFSGKFDLNVCLAYYPPYHSKYNPIERVWGVIEQHGNGSILDTVDSVLKFAQSMTWNGNYPEVHLVETKYRTGIKLDKRIMDAYENIIERDNELGKWFVEIKPEKCKN